MSDLAPSFDMRGYTALTDRLMTALSGELRELRVELRGRLDQIACDGRDVGERLSRIEGMQVGNVQELKDLREETKATNSEIRAMGDKAQKLENRVVRLETLIVPGAAFLSAIASTVVGHLLKGG